MGSHPRIGSPYSAMVAGGRNLRSTAFHKLDRKNLPDFDLLKSTRFLGYVSNQNTFGKGPHPRQAGADSWQVLPVSRNHPRG